MRLITLFMIIYNPLTNFNMNTKDEEYLLERINSAFTQKWYKVTPEFMKELKKEREEYQKQKKVQK